VTLTMAVGDKDSGELEKLLADVQRTIRENDQFIRHLKEEAAGVDGADTEEESDSDDAADDGGYEEL
jgi:hypothetical protein